MGRGICSREMIIHLTRSLNTGNIRINSVLPGYKDIFGYQFLSIFYKAFVIAHRACMPFKEATQGSKIFSFFASFRNLERHLAFSRIHPPGCLYSDICVDIQ